MKSNAQVRRRLDFAGTSCESSSTGLRFSPENPFAVYFPNDSCESSPVPSFQLQSQNSTQCSSELSFESLHSLDDNEPDPAMLTVYVSLRKVDNFVLAYLFVTNQEMKIILCFDLRCYIPTNLFK